MPGNLYECGTVRHLFCNFCNKFCERVVSVLTLIIFLYPAPYWEIPNQTRSIIDISLLLVGDAGKCWWPCWKFSYNCLICKIMSNWIISILISLLLDVGTSVEWVKWVSEHSNLLFRCFTTVGCRIKTKTTSCVCEPRMFTYPRMVFMESLVPPVVWLVGWSLSCKIYTFLYRQLGCLAFSNCPASAWTFSFRTAYFFV